MSKNPNINTTNTQTNPKVTNPFPSSLHIRQMERKIGNTTYIITTRFNGDKKRSVGATLARIISRDNMNGNGFPAA